MMRMVGISDEMNLHVPQSIEAEVEIMVNSRCAAHIVTPQRNAPVNGIVQDGLILSLILTSTWTEDGMQTMVNSKIAMKIYRESEISDARIQDMMARARYTYSTYISTDSYGDFYFCTDEIPGMLFLSILFPCNFCYTKTTDTDPLRPNVEIEDGIMLPSSGPLCTKSVGAKNGSIIHVLWKESQELALYFISELQQLTDRWGPEYGFTFGIRDCFVTDESEIAKVLIETRARVNEIALRNEGERETEMNINTELNNAMSIGPSVANTSMVRGQKNALNIMRNSGAKGSLINLAQIVAFVGQQNIKGKRIPMQLTDGTRCLPSFLPGDTSPEARGFVENNFIRGLNPREAFFHAAGGRDGVIATAIKSVTGETPIIIDCNGTSKYVRIGDWIDELLALSPEKVKRYPERELELLDVSEYNVKIPTTDEYGNVTWALIKNVTRHDPGKELYRIKTLSGRSVTVTESKALLVWSSNNRMFIPKDTPLVKVGDYVPTTSSLPDTTPSNQSITYDVLAGLLTGYMLARTDGDYGIPAEIINASKDFIKGVINGYFSECGIITENSIYSTSRNAMLIDIIGLILNRFEIFGRVEENKIIIENQHVVKFVRWFKLFSGSKRAFLEKLATGSSPYFTEQNNVILDQIVEITPISIEEYHQKYPQYNAKVYDLTVPSTLNFGLANGLHVVDTAETGYMQKKIARKVEDIKVTIDGSLRDNNGRIISFMYGDDGFNAKKVVSVKGQSTPFFVDPTTIARKLNSDARRLKEVEEYDKPRKLTDMEIFVMLSFIQYSDISSPVIRKTTENTHSVLGECVRNIELYECKISNFIGTLVEIYNDSKAPYGLPAGLITSSSVGEPGTQMVLNTFHFAGLKGKDASSGVPRFKELINLTKSKDQKTPTCEIHFNHPRLNTISKELRTLHSKTSDPISEKVEELKKEMLSVAYNFKNTFEETCVRDLIIDYDLRYSGEYFKNIASPIEFVTYDEYIEEWWVALYKKLKGEPRTDITKSWIISFRFDIEKMFKRKLELADIVYAIESLCNGAICTPSPAIIGRIEVYCDLSEFKEEVVSYPKNTPSMSCVTEMNYLYYLYRDVLIDFILDIKVCGIRGISKIYPRLHHSSHELTLETDGVNFLDVLTAEFVDSTQTICDDVYSVLNVLGIEAARALLFKEITRVISFDGTYVNPRHIAVLVDAMLVNGTLDAASRDGISRAVGPNAKIMFEKNIDNAAIACAFTENDAMTSLPSCVMYGKLAKIGSGAVIIRDKDRMPVK